MIDMLSLYYKLQFITVVLNVMIITKFDQHKIFTFISTAMKHTIFEFTDGDIFRRFKAGCHSSQIHLYISVPSVLVL